MTPSKGFSYIKKTLKSANQPYKSSSYGYYFWRDLFLPIAGALELANVVLVISLTPLLFLGLTVACLFPQFRKGRSFLSSMKDVSLVVGHSLKVMFNKTLQGVFMLAIYAPALLIGIPHRLYLTKKLGSIKLQDNQRHRDLVNSIEQETHQEHPDYIKLIAGIRLLIDKFFKAEDRGRAFSREENEETTQRINELLLMKLPTDIIDKETTDAYVSAVDFATTRKKPCVIYVNDKKGIFFRGPIADVTLGLLNKGESQISSDNKWCSKVTVDRIPPFISLFTKAIATRDTQVATRPHKISASSPNKLAT